MCGELSRHVSFEANQLTVTCSILHTYEGVLSRARIRQMHITQHETVSQRWYGIGFRLVHRSANNLGICSPEYLGWANDADHQPPTPVMP